MSISTLGVAARSLLLTSGELGMPLGLFTNTDSTNGTQAHKLKMNERLACLVAVMSFPAMAALQSSHLMFLMCAKSCRVICTANRQGLAPGYCGISYSAEARPFACPGAMQCSNVPETANRKCAAVCSAIYRIGLDQLGRGDTRAAASLLPQGPIELHNDGLSSTHPS